MEVCLLFPHQLFSTSPLYVLGLPIYIVEEYLFFRQYPFHKQKIAFHRASMKSHAADLQRLGIDVRYIDAHDDKADSRILIDSLGVEGVHTLHHIDPTDDWLTRRIQASASVAKMEVRSYQSPLFLNNPAENYAFFRPDKKKFFHATFYKQQRQKFGLLLESDGGPLGGQWSFDADNRKRYPKDKQAPSVKSVVCTEYHLEAERYVTEQFGEHLGDLNESFRYPVTHQAAEEWLEDFFINRFHEFGVYEDALVAQEHLLNHSLISPLLNCGLLTAEYIISQSLAYAQENEIPINSLEGFVRQIIGWREFIRGVYESVGRKERTTNFWGYTRKIPPAFYTGDTGVTPVDEVIKKVLKTGYCHHIERLMVLGNFMLLCEFDPDEVYQWFMELFIDSYDWVMVTNVYGMSQFADGGLMATKPYISSSNYLMKMSDYKKGEWQSTWDALFWRFMHVNRDFFTSNPRLGMLIRTLDKMADEKRMSHLLKAEEFLNDLD